MKPGAVVVDVAVNRTEDGLVGDVDKDVADIAGFLTSRAGQRRSDDDCDALAQYPHNRATSADWGCVARFLGATFQPVQSIDVGCNAGRRHRCRRT